jgi:DnaA family protein
VVECALAEKQSAIYARDEVPDAAQVVAVDDVEKLDGAAQISLFALFNRQRESGGLLLVSGTQAPVFLPLRDDLRTRLGWGLVYQVQALNDAEKEEALRQHAQARGFELPNEVTTYLLRHGRRDLPALLTTLDALDEHCLRLKRAASVPLLKEVLR